MSATPQTTARACLVCGRPDPACPRLRDDDRHCLLDGARILHLQVGLPVADDHEVFLYQDPTPGAPLVLHLTWLRGLKAQPKRQNAPRIDFGRSWAQFSGVEVGERSFRFKEHPAANPTSPWVMALLVPDPPGASGPSLPLLGVAGTLTVATSAGEEQRPARLFPRPDPIHSIECVELEHTAGAELWQVHDRGASIRLPMRLVARVPFWVRPAADIPNQAPGGQGIRLEGFAQPPAAAVVPGRPYPFALVIDTTAWQVGAEVPFAFRLKLVNDSNPAGAVLTGRVVLTDSPRIRVPAGGTLVLPMKLGQIREQRFIVAQAEGGATAVTLKDYEVERRPDVGEWLTVAEPERKTLPREVRRVDDQGREKLELVFELLIDTSRLDRAAFAGKQIEGTVRLMDSLKRPLEYLVHVPLERRDPLPNDIAIDWGTTNSCAAYWSGAHEEPVMDVPLAVEAARPGQAPRDQFPSDIYFTDASRRDDPKFEIGEKALGGLFPECRVRSVKRKFQTGGKVPIIDEKNPGEITPYPVELIVEHLLFRMVLLAEESRNEEVRKLGLTFPTKWTKETRTRFMEVAKRLEARLAAKYGAEAQVRVHEPEIDEANAVALELLFRLGAVPGTGGRGVVIAYDFGGGTVDTSVLEVSKVGLNLKTRYIGLGGLSHFGGDEVTRAVMMLLRQKLVAALKDFNLEGKETTSTRRLDSVPLEPDIGDNTLVSHDSYRLGRKNWSVLWEVAERIKIDLCGGAPAANLVQTHLAEVLNLVSAVVVRRANDYDEDLGRLVEGPPQRETTALGEVFIRLGAEARERVYRGVAFDLPEVYGQKIEDIEFCNAGKPYSVRDRVKETVDELAWQCRHAETPVAPDVIVLAGGGSRLPLIRALMEEAFRREDGRVPQFEVPDAPKSLVARGMASYLANNMTDLKIEPARSVEVLHHHLGIMRVPTEGFQIKPVFCPIVHAGAPLHANVWRPFEFSPKRDGPGGGARLALCVQSWRGKRDVGFVPFHATGSPLAGDPPCVAGPLPGQDGPYHGELRLQGLGRIEVHVLLGENRHGPFLLDLLGDDVESILQG